MGEMILTDRQLSNSAYSHVIHAPIDKVDIAAWLFNLPEAEYVVVARSTTSLAGPPAPMMGRRCRSMSR